MVKFYLLRIYIPLCSHSKHDFLLVEVFVSFDMMGLVFFLLASLLASICVADCHRHPKASPYKGLNMSYKKVLIPC